MPEDPLSLRLCRWLLKLYPPGFRENYAELLEREFRKCKVAQNTQIHTRAQNEGLPHLLQARDAIRRGWVRREHIREPLAGKWLDDE